MIDQFIKEVNDKYGSLKLFAEYHNKDYKEVHRVVCAGKYKETVVRRMLFYSWVLEMQDVVTIERRRRRIIQGIKEYDSLKDFIEESGFKIGAIKSIIYGHKKKYDKAFQECYRYMIDVNYRIIRQKSLQ